MISTPFQKFSLILQEGFIAKYYFSFLGVSVTTLLVFCASLGIEDADMLDDFRQMRRDQDVNTFLAEEFFILQGVSCRPGYYNLSTDFIDAATYCAGAKGPSIGRKKLKGPTVNFGGSETPLLCLRVCTSQQAGLTNRNYIGFNETALFKIFRSEMRKPGGEMSAFKLTKELMECDRKWRPVVFPTSYHNCSQVEDVYRCTRRVMFDCTDKSKKYVNEWLEYLREKRLRNMDNGNYYDADDSGEKEE